MGAACLVALSRPGAKCGACPPFFPSPPFTGGTAGRGRLAPLPAADCGPGLPGGCAAQHPAVLLVCGVLHQRGGGCQGEPGCIHCAAASAMERRVRCVVASSAPVCCVRMRVAPLAAWSARAPCMDGAHAMPTSCPTTRNPRPPRCAQGPGRGTRSLGWKPLLLVVTIRFLLLPALGAVVVAGTVAAGWYLPPNPLFAFLMLLQVRGRWVGRRQQGGGATRAGWAATLMCAESIPPPACGLPVRPAGLAAACLCPRLRACSCRHAGASCSCPAALLPPFRCCSTASPPATSARIWLPWNGTTSRRWVRQGSRTSVGGSSADACASLACILGAAAGGAPYPRRPERVSVPARPRRRRAGVLELRGSAAGRPCLDGLFSVDAGRLSLGGTLKSPLICCTALSPSPQARKPASPHMTGIPTAT